MPRLAFHQLTCFLVVGLSVAPGCGDSGGSTADSRPDLPASDGVLWRCDDPGQSCNPHDNCAINPRCGQDFVCRGERYQNCSDDLDCTIDSCKGLGLCKNEPKPGFCVLNTRGSTGGRLQACFAKGDVNPDDPCEVCDPEVDPLRWSPRTGGTCDDDEPCTKDDTCQQGVCKGTYFGDQCDDGLSCTRARCDGRGGCTPELDTNACLIAGVCYFADQRKDDGCGICKPLDNQHAWTALPSFCSVGGRCVAAGERDASGCGVCDPQLDQHGWSRATDRCLIDGICYQSGDPQIDGCGTCDPARGLDRFSPPLNSCEIGDRCLQPADPSPSGCGQCAPSENPLFWIPRAAVSAVSEGFENGMGGYTLGPSVGSVGWQLSQKRAANGTTSLYFGNPGAGNYDGGTRVTGIASTPPFALPAGQKAALTFAIYLDVEPSRSADRVEVRIGQTVLWAKATHATTYRRFVRYELDLSSFAGTTIRVDFSFDSVDGFANTGEGLYLDDVTLLTNCGAI